MYQYANQAPLPPKPPRARKPAAAPAAPETDPLAPVRDFSSLSLMDLLRARDLYHRHLTEKRGVLATAVGRYLIRVDDPKPGENKPRPAGRPRRLKDSEVRSYSWPAVIVFVRKWLEPDELAKAGYTRNDLVPQTLHLPDGKSVPVCVVEAAPEQVAVPRPLTAVYPKEFIGGGYPLEIDVQGERRVASVGCLVTDGHMLYAVTNRHVAGRPGEKLYSSLGGVRELVGVSSDKQLGRSPFAEAYPGWPGENLFVNFDIGLVEIVDKSNWTPQIFGIGKVGGLADLGQDDLSLRTIGMRVRAYGAASHEMYGQILGLFYRYKSVGGFEHVSDFMIGPRPGVPFDTHPGDSGTVWLLEWADEKGKIVPRPLAVQWGGHVLESSTGEKQSYALATNLSLVCAKLGVDLVRDWGQSIPEYWGAVGHFTIANLAVAMMAASGQPKLAELMENNLTMITLAMPDIVDSKIKAYTKEDFVPLADVPDLAWKQGKSMRGKEGPNHFADMDETANGLPSLLELCKDTTKIDPDVWAAHVTAMGGSPKTAGLLPFRIRQIYQEMVAFAAAGKGAEFVCAAGVLAHYVGDACQPLHISYLHHGDPADQVPTSGGKMKNRADDVHTDYEASMFKSHGGEMQTQLAAALAGKKPVRFQGGGKAAARRAVALMRRTYGPGAGLPRTMVDFYTAALLAGKTRAEIVEMLWTEYRARTIAVMKDGVRELASLWRSAWADGGGEGKVASTAALDPADAIAIYRPKTFLQSYSLVEIGAQL